MLDNFQNIQQVLSTYGDNVIAAINTNLAAHSAASPLQFTYSIATADDGTIVFNVQTTDEVNGQPTYWRWLDSGRSAGKMPPVEPIMDWATARAGMIQFKSVLQKTTVRRNTKNKISGKVTLSVQQRQIQQMAWAVAKSIAKKGTKPTNFFSSVFDSGAAGDTDVLQQQLAQAATQDVTVLLTASLCKA